MEQKLKIEDPSTLLLSNDEKEILKLYNELQELSTQLAFMRTRREYVSRPENLDANQQATEEEIRNAQNRLSRARAEYNLRQSVIENVMEINPILRAVHNGTQASPIERDILPYVEKRDDASIAVMKHAADNQELLDKLSEVEIEAIELSRENVDLAAEVIGLAERANSDSTASMENPAHQEQVLRLERELKASRQRWKIIKGTTSAVVVGSGVDWVEDEKLRDMVLETD